MGDVFAYLLGATYTLLIGGLVIAHLMLRLRGKRVGEVWHTAEAGFVEKAIYFIAFSISQPIFAGAWVALKVAARWEKWGTQPGLFNTFAIGTGLSLLFAVAGSQAAAMVAKRDWEAVNWPVVASIGIAPLLLAGLVWLIAEGPQPIRRLFNPEAE